jgi:hypothetical protein
MKANTSAFLKVTMPAELILPADTDLNALFAIMRKARVLETIYSADDMTRANNDKYTGPSTYFLGDEVVPTVSGFVGCSAFNTRKEAQDAKNKIVQDAMAEREANAPKVEVAPQPEAPKPAAPSADNF